MQTALKRRMVLDIHISCNYFLHLDNKVPLHLIFSLIQLVTLPIRQTIEQFFSNTPVAMENTDDLRDISREAINFELTLSGK